MKRTLEEIGALPEDEMLTTEEILQFPYMAHLKPCTLAKWRQIGKGPAFTTIGRKAFYERRDVEQWRQAQKRHGTTQESRPLALPIHAERTPVRRVHRLGGYQTKRERGQSDRSAEAACD